MEYKSPTKESRLNTAGTNLNICSILSKIGKHTSALKHAKEALNILLQLVKSGSLDENTKISLIIAYYNSGLEAEAVGSYNEAQRMYEQGH
jgi:tetratricopeptide (TPR) repeat protein